VLQQQPYNRYLETTVQTATPAQLLIMLYDGAIRFSRQGIEALKQNKYEEANRCLVRVQDIIQEFVITLDRNAPMSDSLLQLYEYFIHRLIEGNVKKQSEPIEEVMGYLIDLKETWVQASRTANASHAGDSGYTAPSLNIGSSVKQA